MSQDTPAEVTGRSTTWWNWSGNIQHKGEHYYFRPTGKAELRSILAGAKAAGITVRASGQRHSQPPLVAADNRNQTPPPEPKLYLLDMSCYIDIGSEGIELGPGPNQVTLNPGVREDDVDAFLTANNLMMSTVTAGGFFSLGGMTAVDVHGATIDAPIFAETAAAFTLMNAHGEETTIDADSKGPDGESLLPFARVSLGALGVVTRIVLDVIPRPWATTLLGGHERYLLKDKAAFQAQFGKLLTGPARHTRMETFYTPYAAAKNVPFPPLKNFLVLWWDVVDDPDQKIPNQAPDPATACALSEKGKFGAPLLGGLANYAAKYVRASQYYQNAYDPFHFPPVPPSGYTAIGLDEIEDQANKANAAHSDLWLTEASQVMFMSYFIALPTLDADGLAKVWDALQVAGDYVIEPGHFHIAAPMEFRFIKGGDSAMAGTYTSNPETWFVNLDLIGFIEPTVGADYPDALLKFFATVERAWVAMGGLPHNGKMYGFYDPDDADNDSYTAPFNTSFLRFVTQRRIDNGAPVEAFLKYRKLADPDNRFYNQYLNDLFAGV